MIGIAAKLLLILQALAPATTGRTVAIWSNLPRGDFGRSANCTTVIFGMAHRLDWRIPLPSQLPSHLREREFVSREMPLKKLVGLNRTRAAPPPDPQLSTNIRKGVLYPVRKRR